MVPSPAGAPILAHQHRRNQKLEDIRPRHGHIRECNEQHQEEVRGISLRNSQGIFGKDAEPHDQRSPWHPERTHHSGGD